MRIIRRDGQAADLVFGLSGLAAVLLTVALAALSSREPSLSVCIWHRLTGLPCLTCGTTRALLALMDGRVTEAFRLQPFVLGAVALISLLCVADLVGLLALRRALRLFLTSRERWLLAGMALLAAALDWLYLFYTLP